MPWGLISIGISPCVSVHGQSLTPFVLCCMFAQWQNSRVGRQLAFNHQDKGGRGAPMLVSVEKSPHPI